MVIPDQQEDISQLDYAGFWARFAAYIIDGLILCIICSSLVPVISFGFLMPWYWWIDSFSNEPDFVPFWFIGSGVLLWLLIWGAYFVGFWVWRAQTPGKMALRLKVFRLNGSAITVETALIRYLGYLICGICLLIPFLWVAIDNRKQGIHDKLAQTYVLSSQKKEL